VYETMVYETCLYCLIHTPWCLHIHYCLHICTPVTHLVLHYTFCLKLHVLSHLHILSLTYTRHITWNAKRIWYKLVKAVERKHNFKQEFAKIAFTICAWCEEICGQGMVVVTGALTLTLTNTRHNTTSQLHTLSLLHI